MNHLCREPLDDKLKRMARGIFSNMSAATTEAEFENLFVAEIKPQLERLVDQRVSETIAAALA